MATFIDDDTEYAQGAAQRPGAPFPEKDNIPSGDLDPTLDEPDGKPDAFGSADTAAPDDVEDATLDDPEDPDQDIPVTPEEAAKAFGEGDAGNEYDNTAISEWHKANNTSAEALSGGEHQTDKAVDPEAGGKASPGQDNTPNKAENTLDDPREDDKPKRAPRGKQTEKKTEPEKKAETKAGA